MQVIIFSNERGGVTVCYPTGELPIEQVQAKDTPAGSIIVDNDSLPNADVDFFDAWELANESVMVNLSKAQQITKDRLRRERAPLMAALDVQFQRALETGADTTAIVAEKQRLRDITKLADAAASLDELRTISC